MESALLDEMTSQLSHFSKRVPRLRKYARMAQVAGTEHGKERVHRWTMERGV